MTLANKCFGGLAKRQILTEKDFVIVTKSESYDKPLPNSCKWRSESYSNIIHYDMRENGLLIRCNGAHVYICNDDVQQGYNHVMDIWEDD
jgi:hypothetical protein